MFHPSISSYAFSLGLLAAAFLPASSPGALNVVIQPSVDLAKTYFTVSWDSLAGGVDFGSDQVTLGDPSDHLPSVDSVVIFMLWSEFGDFKSQASNDVYLGDGSPGYTSSNSSFGVYLDDDFEGGVGDDFGVIFRGASFPSSGSFVAETTTWNGGFSTMWKTGTHNGPGGSTIVVTTTGYVPEPTPALLLAVMGIHFLAARSRNPPSTENRRSTL